MFTIVEHRALRVARTHAQVASPLQSACTDVQLVGMLLDRSQHNKFRLVLTHCSVCRVRHAMLQFRQGDGRWADHDDGRWSEPSAVDDEAGIVASSWKQSDWKQPTGRVRGGNPSRPGLLRWQARRHGKECPTNLPRGEGHITPDQRSEDGLLAHKLQVLTLYHRKRPEELDKVLEVLKKRSNGDTGDEQIPLEQALTR